MISILEPNFLIQLDGKTKLKGSSIPNNPPANISYATEEKNTFIVVLVEENRLKMVRIRVTGETTFDWIDAKYKDGPSANCKVEETFNEECYIGQAVLYQNHYDVELSAIIKGSNFSI